MTERLARGGHRVVAFDASASAMDRARACGAFAAGSLPELVSALQSPRAVWIMVPSGDAVDATISELLPRLSPGDVLIDGGNSNYRDTMRRGQMVQGKGMHFLDVGTSGGIWGLRNGYSLMIGGSADVVRRLQPIFETLAPASNKGWAHVGPCGSGHFVKMVHNGIEYGMMESFAEGFSLLSGKKEFGLDLAQIADVWRDGSVVRSWLLDLAADALRENPSLDGVDAYVEDSGEGRWMVAECIEMNVPAPVITQSLIERLRSRERGAFSYKLLAMMRAKFGGHAVRSEGPQRP